jgi:hypothetical protein
MRKTLLIIAVLAIATTWFGANAFASVQPSFEQIYMTDAAGSHTPKAGTIPSFGWAETPYLYVKLGMGGLSNVIFSLFYQDPQNSTQATPAMQSGDEYWFSPANWNNTGVKNLGAWKADLGAHYPGGYLYDSQSFTVTPEPVSSALFLLGGGALALYRYKRKK